MHQELESPSRFEGLVDRPSIDGWVDALLVFADRAHLAIERQAARRMLAEASVAWPGPPAERWWKWLIEAGRSLGLPLRVTELTARDAFTLAGGGCAVCGLANRQSQDWVLLAETRRRRAHAVTSGSGTRLTWYQIAELQQRFSDQPIDSVQRWVVLEQVDLAGHRHERPLRRLWRLLVPETSDLWVILIIGVFIGLLAIAVPIAGQQLVRTVTFGALYQPLLILAVMLFCFLAFLGALHGLQIFVVELIQRRIFARMVADLSFRIPRVQTQAVQQAYPPELVNRFFDVLTVQKVLAGILVDGMSLVLSTAFGMSLLAFYHPFLLGYDVVLLTLMVLAVVIFGRGGTRTAITESIAKYRTAAWLQEIARCSLSFRLYGGADFAADRADRLTAEYLGARQQHFRVFMRQVGGILTLQALASTVLLGLGGYLVLREQLTLGQLVAAELVVATIVTSFAKLLKHIEGYYDLMAAMDKLGHLIDLPIETTSGVMTLPTVGGCVVHADRLSGSIMQATADEHAAGADGHDHGHQVKPIFAGLKFTVPAGETLAVIGPPGSGKSLLLDILYGLREPAAGLLTIDGYAPTDVRYDVLRRHVAMVRDVEILSGTIAENVHLGRMEVDTEAVRTAVEYVGLSDELGRLTLGLETTISSMGRPLTDSQARRVVLARALAGAPRLLLIDGLLDQLSDDLLDEVLPRLFNAHDDLTVIVVSGRREIVSRCQKVLDLGGHCVLSTGSEALAEMSGQAPSGRLAHGLH